jgi:hypothetical protein
VQNMLKKQQLLENDIANHEVSFEALLFLIDSFIRFVFRVQLPN